MKKSTKRLFAALLAATSLLALTACGGGKTEAPKTDDSKTEQPAETSGSKELSVYTAFPESEVIYYFNKFEQETGIKINYVRLSAGEMLTRVYAEWINVLNEADSNHVTLCITDNLKLQLFPAKD